LTAPSSATSSVYLRRAAALRETFDSLGIDSLLLTHLPNIRYLTGFDGSTGAVLLTSDRCTLLVDGRYLTSAQERTRSSEALRHVSVELAPRSLDEAVAATAARLPLRRLGVEAGVMTIAQFGRLQKMTAGELIPTERAVESHRLVKDEAEIAAFRQAGRMLSAAAVEALAAVEPGRTEQEVAVQIEQALRTAGFAKPAFETIVASGPNSALPHARPGSRVLAAGNPVVLDFGGVYDGYCVDLTRTVQLRPASDSFMRIFAAVAEAHAAAVAAVRPGVMASAIDAAARDVLAARGFGDAFVHGTGHGLGLEIHEEPRVTRAGTVRDEALRPGMVFTIEPGAYVPGAGGVRIEDDVLVTEQGCEVLTSVPIDGGGYGAAAREMLGSRSRGPAGE
jgi:Xaa-Pro aminopeptidase